MWFSVDLLWYALLCLPELLDVTLRFDIFPSNLTPSLSSTV